MSRSRKRDLPLQVGIEMAKLEVDWKEVVIVRNFSDFAILTLGFGFGVLCPGSVALGG